MLKILVPGIELYNETTQEFIKTKDTELTLEHSLISISKWESKWCKAFLSRNGKTIEESVDYVRAMTLNQNVDEWVYKSLTQPILDEIQKYIEAPMTATRFFGEDRTARFNNETITSELIYYWIIAFNIDWQVQKWHLNRLLTLIDLCNRKNQPKKRMSANELKARNRMLNDERRARLGTKG